MFTMIFRRCLSSDDTGDVTEISSYRTKDEVLSAIKNRLYIQCRDETNMHFFQDKHWYYGDYGICIIRDGIITYESPGFNNTSETFFIDCDYDDSDLWSEFHTAYSLGTNICNLYQLDLYDLQSIERRFKEENRVNEAQRSKKLETEKEKALLEELLAKYPEMGQTR